MFSGKEKVIKGVKNIAGGVIVQLQGSFDMSCSSDLRQQMMDILVNPPQTLIVDMTDVECMDSSGLAILIEALKLSRRSKCNMKLAAINKRVKGVFEIARVETLFDIYTDVKSATE